MLNSSSLCFVVVRTLVFATVFLAGEGLAVLASVHDAHSNAVSGSPTVIGFAGAYRAEADGINAAIYNPAGLSLMDDWWDASFTFGSFNQGLSDSVTTLDSDSGRILYGSIGLVFRVPRWRDFGFGLVFHNPYEMSLAGEAQDDLGRNENVKFSFENTNLLIPLSLRISENLAVGLTMSLNAASSEFSKFGGGSASQSTIGTGFVGGALYRWNDGYKTSLTYHRGSRLGLDSDSAQDLGFTPFREARLPQQLYIGHSYRLNPRWLFLLDTGLVFGIEGGIFPGSGLSEAVPEVPSGRQTQFQYHMAAEWKILPNKWEARFGHYFQPARISGDIHRFHVTGGLDYFFWYIKVGLAVDRAQKYYNFGLSVSPSFAHRQTSGG